MNLAEILNTSQSRVVSIAINRLYTKKDELEKIKKFLETDNARIDPKEIQ